MRDHFNRLSTHMQGVLIVTLGVTILSFDALLIRLAGVDGWDVIFWRAGLSTLTLMGLLWYMEGRRAWSKIKACLRGVALLCTLTFGLNTILFVQSISYTTVSNTLVILASGPMFAALFSRVLLHEVIPIRTWIAIALGITGVLVVFSGSLASVNLLGDSLALALAVVQGINFTLLRKLHNISRIALIGLSGIPVVPIALLAATPLGLPAESYLYLAIMGLLQMPMAMVLISMGTRYLKAPEVVLFMMLETLLGSLLVWLILDESIPARTLAGGTLIILTLVAHTLFSARAANRAANQSATE